MDNNKKRQGKINKLREVLEGTNGAHDFDSAILTAVSKAMHEHTKGLLRADKMLDEMLSEPGIYWNYHFSTPPEYR